MHAGFIEEDSTDCAKEEAKQVFLTRNPTNQPLSIQKTNKSKRKRDCASTYGVRRGKRRAGATGVLNVKPDDMALADHVSAKVSGNHPTGFNNDPFCPRTNSRLSPDACSRRCGGSLAKANATLSELKSFIVLFFQQLYIFCKKNTSEQNYL